MIECYHDRIREAVAGGLSAELARERHLALALALERRGDADPERLLTHFLEAGERARARMYALRAADNAFGALAFDRAADLYGRCLELYDVGATEREGLLIKQATSLSNAGRGPEAAEAYLAAAEAAPPEQAWELRSEAAQALLGCGHLDRGRSLLRDVLRNMGISVPGSGAGAMVSFMMLRARLSMRGLTYKEQRQDQLDRGELDRIDACTTAAAGIGLADPVEGAVFQTRALLMSLESGEPTRICRALGLEAAYTSISGIKGLARTRELLHMARALALRLDDRNLDAAVDTNQAIAALQIGDWTGCFDAANRARQTLRELRSRGHWLLGTAEAYLLAGLGFLGRLDDALEQFTRILESARSLGDLHLETHARLGMEFNPFLITDRPAEAEADVRGALEQWPLKKGFTLQHAYGQRALAQIALYRGDAGQALELATQGFSKLNRSSLRTVGLILALNREQQGRARLAAAMQGGEIRATADQGSKKRRHDPGRLRPTLDLSRGDAIERSGELARGEDGGGCRAFRPSRCPVRGGGHGRPRRGGPLAAG